MTVAMTPEDAKGVVRRAAAGPDGRGARARPRLAVQLPARFLPRREVGHRAGTTSCSRTSACRTCCGSFRAPTSSSKTEFEDHEKATAAAIAAKGLSLVEAKPGGKWAVLTVATDTPGTMSRVEYEAFVADLVNYLDYMAEPVAEQAHQPRHRRAAVPRRAVRVRVLDEAGRTGRTCTDRPSPAQIEGPSCTGRSHRSCLLHQTIARAHEATARPNAAGRTRP